MTTPIQFTCTHCGYVASTEYGEGLREQIARLTTALAQAERERDRAKGTLVEWLRNMEAPVIRAFGEERWEQARQEIFAEGNAGWTTILGVAAERLRADIDAARAEVERLNEQADDPLTPTGSRRLAQAEAEVACLRPVVDLLIAANEAHADPHCGHCAAAVAQARAALEGRG
ncbi:MAG TPA: hypothetical protein VLA89_05645 [Gemmatimonadales bacterium]|nr:hypothetical protein [Gemmatimonadales bacterium]